MESSSFSNSVEKWKDPSPTSSVVYDKSDNGSSSIINNTSYDISSIPFDDESIDSNEPIIVPEPIISRGLVESRNDARENVSQMQVPKSPLFETNCLSEEEVTKKFLNFFTLCHKFSFIIY